MLFASYKNTHIILVFIITVSVASAFPVVSQWEKTNFPMFRNNPPRRIFQFEQGLYAANYGSLYKSTDNGLNWSWISDFGFSGFSDMEEIENTLIATAYVNKEWPDTTATVFQSIDGGQTWDSLFCSIHGGESIEKLNLKLFIDNDHALYCSPDSGNTWTKINTSGYFTGRISEVIASENSLYVRVKDEQLFRSDDEGLTWTSVLSVDNDDHFTNVAVKNSTILVGTYRAGCLKSTNNGLSWMRVNSGLPESSGFWDIIFCEDYIIGAVSHDFYLTIYKMNCRDTIWYNFNDGLNLARTASIHDFECNDDYLFVASDSSLWRRPITELTTSVNRNEFADIPEGFGLQCFPNPFNSSTTIHFNLEFSSYIQLKIYDILGREVKTLFDGNLDSGEKYFQWNALDVSSGIYFVQLYAANQFETIKIVLAK
ncbi:T9SS type A sorting domain-containing protein [candidate division KSB1 bacterium]|nr:T9SS type A sorting domain-containing protein [candidate division KSB1 bacterium]